MSNPLTFGHEDNHLQERKRCLVVTRNGYVLNGDEYAHKWSPYCISLVGNSTLDRLRSTGLTAVHMLV